MDEEDFLDPACDPDNPVKIKYEDIVAATHRISGIVLRTPCSKSMHLSDDVGVDLYLKQEFLHYTGCFKERGVHNTLMQLTEEQKKHGVITASVGNHAMAISLVASQMEIPCVVVLPTWAAFSKVERCRHYGAQTILHGNDMLEAKKYAMNICRDRKMFYINGNDNPQIIEGHGSIGVELVAQVPGMDAVLVPVGGGALIVGVATVIKHLKPEVEIYGIETEKTCSMFESTKRGERVKVDGASSSIADDLAIPVGVNTFHCMKNIVDKMVVVKEEFVARAILHLVDREKFVVEGAGAVGIAALLAGLFPALKGKRVVCILTGGNIETPLIARALERGMAAEGRLVKFKVRMKDKPGGLVELYSLLADIGVTVRESIPERAWVQEDIFSVMLMLVCETRGWGHTKVLVEHVKKNFESCFFPNVDENKPPEPSSNARRGPCPAPNPICLQKSH